MGVDFMKLYGRPMLCYCIIERTQDNSVGLNPIKL